MRLKSARPTGPARRRRRSGRRGEALAFYGFVSPWLIGTAVLTVFPVGYAFYLSFTAWDGIAPFKPWVGLDNYREVLTSADTLSSLARTLTLVAIIVPTTIAGSLLLALLLNERVRGRTVFRTLIYIPAIVPPVAASLIWKVAFDQNSGGVNRFLHIFGVNALMWLTGNRAFIVLVIVLLWGIGAGLIINLAALQTVPAEQLEAVRLDGGGAFTAFRHVTLPVISPVLLFQTVLVTITTLQTFVPVLLLSPISDGVANVYTNIPNANRVYMVDVYSQFFSYSRYGYGSAMLTIFFLVIVALTVLIFKVAGRSVFYAVDPNAAAKEG
ncbi:sugar ABC transporter permease [Streptomyces sp. NBC_00201]|uniref:carbohydrate ABC transporter permease n=1 Tax=unclassified Streptomyces TaxID=2593676 RepID=UPI002254851A|nr:MULTISPECIES: sugar ABC transporter permease [unclassified Streptomyces]MCX5247630.1 sugar ABC transporter permease [Streptomyces sp. NBC_00201]MCX5286588.1 sugar ABC transporter permease [Streptomyces sp. NBC_00183]